MALRVARTSVIIAALFPGVWAQEPSPLPTQNPTPARPSAFVALSALYHGTGGPDWTKSKGNWMSSTDPCDFSNNGDFAWDGIGCLGNLEVSSLDLHEYTLAGTLPSQLGLLTSLTNLALNGNSLQGTLPSQFGRLTLLEASFQVQQNRLTGPLPSELGQLTRMTAFFTMGQNFFSGSIPSQLGRLTAMSSSFSLQSNSLSLEIPSELGLLTALTNLFKLNENSLCGDVPNEVAQLSSTVITNFDYTTGNSNLGTDCCDVFPSAPGCGAPMPLPTSVPTLACIAGQVYVEGACEDCPPGTFSDFQGPPFPESCTPCAAGQFNIGFGSDTCKPCAVGKVTTPERTGCEDCSRGQNEQHHRSKYLHPLQRGPVISQRRSSRAVRTVRRWKVSKGHGPNVVRRVRFWEIYRHLRVAVM
jgi:hypothetical protein